MFQTRQKHFFDIFYLLQYRPLYQSIQFIISTIYCMPADTCSHIDEQVLQVFQLIKKVGQGAYGKVWKAKIKQGSRICALKKIQNAFGSTTDAQKVYRQIKYLEKLNHPNIVKMLRYQLPQNSQDIYIALQYMEADLSLAIRNGVLKQIHKHFIFSQIANGVHYMHSAQLIHRDLKPSNILVNQHSEIKICDLGLIRSLVPDQLNKENCLTQKIATRWYRPPQILLCSKNYGKQVDIWSLGCILAEIFLGRPLFQGSSAVSQLQKIFEVLGKPSRQQLSFVKSEASKSIVESMTTSKIKNFLDIFPNEDKLLIDLLQKIFRIVPKQRLTIQQIISHPFVNKFKGKFEITKNVDIIKIKNQSKKLTIQEYKSLLLDQSNRIYHDLKTGKASQPSTYYQSSVTHSLPNNSRQQYFKSLSPLGRFDKQSPQRQMKVNSRLVSYNNLNLQNKIDKKQIFKTIKSNHQQKKQLMKRKEEFQRKYNIHLENTFTYPVNILKSPPKLLQDKQKYTRYVRSGLLMPFSPLKIFTEFQNKQSSCQKFKYNRQLKQSPPKSLQKRMKSIKDMLKVFQSKSRSRSSKNSPKKIADKSPMNENSRAIIHKTVGNKQSKRQNIVPKFILEGRKKFRSQSPPEQLIQARQNLFKTKHPAEKKQESMNQTLFNATKSKSKPYNLYYIQGFPINRLSYNFLRQQSSYIGS